MPDQLFRWPVAATAFIIHKEEQRLNLNVKKRFLRDAGHVVIVINMLLSAESHTAMHVLIIRTFIARRMNWNRRMLPLLQFLFLVRMSLILDHFCVRIS